MPFLKIPSNISTSVEAHQKWLEIFHKAEKLIDGDIELQQKAAKFLRLKERSLPPEVLGSNYALYCDLINKMYDAYLNSVHMQRSPYMLEIISVFVKRLYEVRNELVHVIVNDYVYVDAALSQLQMTPFDIQEKSAAEFNLGGSDEDFQGQGLFRGQSSTKEVAIVESVHTIISEEFIQACIIQKYERFRQYFLADFRAKCRIKKMFVTEKVKEAPINIKIKAASLIQQMYRRFMEIKREIIKESKRDMLLGLIPDPNKKRLSFEEENTKMYDRRRKTRMKIQMALKRELEKENQRLIVTKKDDQIEDITIQIKEWFKEWFYGYGFFPEFPYEIEGGTMLVIRELYPTIEEKLEADEKFLAATKGKTKEQLKQEKNQAKADAALKAEAAKDAAKKEHEQIIKMRCNPLSDPGYQVQQSEVTGDIAATLQKYRNAWSIYDRFPADTCADIIYGYLKPVLTEDLMCQMHQECRVFVDELMRLDLKLLIKMHQLMYKSVGWKFPKQPTRPKPKAPPVPKPLNVDSTLLQSLESLFDLGIISKPSSKIKDIFGDLNYAAYEFNLRDPDAKFPPPGYGDVKSRLLLSCVFGSGIQPGANRNKAVMLVGPPRNGKSYLVDCVAGEMNAVKIDISPSVFSAVVDRPAKMLSLVFIAAKVFQPAVVYCRDIEKVFAKKVPPEDKNLKAKSLKAPLGKMLKQISNDDKIIFIATCTYPLTAQTNPMVSLFTELILVPRTDYGTLQQFFYNKLQSIRSMPRDYCVQAIAQMMQGCGFGIIMELFNEIMNAERIVRLNVTPLMPSEFLEAMIDKGIEPLTVRDYQEYMDFYIKNSPLNAERTEYEFINAYRGVVYSKMAKENAEKTDQ